MEQISTFDEVKEIADQQPKWGNAPVTVYKGRIGDIRPRLPFFERQPFALHLSAQSPQIINPYLDMIVRQPAQDDKRIIPVGTVSKKYTLVQHTRVFDMAVKALESGGIKTDTPRYRIDNYRLRRENGNQFFSPQRLFLRYR